MTWLSYFSPLTLYKSKSKLGTLIEVREVLGLRKMDLDGYPQSNDTYRRYWKRILKKYIVGRQESGRALVLGLGGGDLAKIITRLLPQWHATYVEIDAEVANVARDYFGIDQTKNLKIVVADAKKYMAANHSKYDLVIIDLYSGDKIPHFVSQTPFLHQIKRSLSPGQDAIFNYASHSFGEDDFVNFGQKLSSCFGSMARLTTGGHNFYLVRG